MKKHNYERWVIAFLSLILIVVYLDKRKTVREMEETIVKQENKIEDLTESLKMMEMEREDLIDAIDLREGEVSFWGRLSDLYREGKRREAEEMRGRLDKYDKYE